MNHYINLNGYECHHIVPKSWKPEWDKAKDNFLKIPTKAHYVIHHLMWKAFPDDHFMKLSFWYLSNKNNIKITAQIFKLLRTEIKIIQKKNVYDRIKNGTHNFLGIRNPTYQRILDRNS